jgi:nickel-dependent lactate racemase
MNSTNPTTRITLRTGVWHNDHRITLTFPPHWRVRAHFPDTPEALSEADIRAIMAEPVGQPPLHRLAEGKRRPLIIVDDLARPTPAFRIMPYLLEELNRAGLSDEQARILVATGTHGHQDPAALRRKLGDQAVDTCRVIIHNDRDRRELKYLGKTSSNSPVFINRAVGDSDLLIGVGGVYPQHTTGFGGGSKLCLGILGRKTITHLHFKHKGVAGTYTIDNSFRRELDEIAHMIGLKTMFTLHTNADLELVSLMCGDHFRYYADAARFSRQKYDAPYPSHADVVIANAYPSDISYTFMRKAMKVIRCAPAKATKIVIASNCEGLGEHGLFQQGLSERIRIYKALYHRISVMEPKVIARKILKHIFKTNAEQHEGVRQNETIEQQVGDWILYRPPGPGTDIPPLPGVQVVQKWDTVLKRIEEEQAGKKDITVQLFACASLQCIESDAAAEAAAMPVAAMLDSI